MPVPEILAGVRVVASPADLDAATWPAGATTLRLAPDELLVLGTDRVEVADPHALVEVEEGFSALSLSRSELAGWMEREAEWSLPQLGSAQGMAAGLPVKVWAEGERALLLTRSSLAAELERRL